MPLCTLLFIGKIKARHADDIEERLTDNPRRCVIDSPQTGFQAARQRKPIFPHEYTFTIIIFLIFHITTQTAASGAGA